MKKNIQKLLRLISVTFLVLSNVLSAVPNVKAYPSPNEVMEDIEDRYHLNQESIQNMGEAMNVSAVKSTMPQVLFTFSPSDPVPGEKLTVKTSQMFFKNTSESLYYTWYLKKTVETAGGTVECELENSPSSDEKKVCDEDGDDKITAEDWKITAMKSLVQGGWRPNYRDKGVENDPNPFDAYYSAVNDNDEDGYRASWGGDLEDGGRKDVNNDGEISITESTDDEKDISEAYCYLYDAFTGEAHEIRTGAGSSVTYAGCDEVKCLRRGTVTCDSTGSEYSACQEIEAAPVCSESTSLITCPGGGAPYCVDSAVFDECSDNTCSGVGAVAYSGEECSNNADSAGETFCRHLFPNAKSERTGDGSFDKSEEKFWGTNPEDQDTADNGNMDEANAAGLGQTEFTWVYSEGDEVGVVAEGNSMGATKHDNSSYMMTWATPVKHCDLSDLSKGVYTKSIKGYPVEIPYVGISDEDAWDEFWNGTEEKKGCLESNLVDPREGGQAGKLNVTLSKTPENPVNLPIPSKKGDIVTVQSTLENLLSKDDSGVKYEWTIEVSNDGSANPSNYNWTEICFFDPDNPNIINSGSDKNCIFDKDSVSKLSGINVPSLSFKLNLKTDGSTGSIQEFTNQPDSVSDEGIFFVRVSLAVRENFDAQTTREGWGNLIFKVDSNTNTINAFIPIVNETTSKLSPDDKDICEEADPDATDPVSSQEIQSEYCYVTKNQIVGVVFDDPGIMDPDKKIENYSWKLDGKNLNCDSKISTSCKDTEATNMAFFPVIKNVGETYTVSMSATRLSKDSEKGKTIQLTRNFVVVDPYVRIVPDPDDGSVIMRKYLGAYTPLGDSVCDADPTLCYDYSDTEFQAAAESANLAFKEEYHPSWIRETIEAAEGSGQMVAQWTVNGEKLDPGSEMTYDFPDDAQVGDVFQISFDAVYQQNNDYRKALYKLWGIDQFQSTEDVLSHTVTLEIIENNEQFSSKSGYQKFFATIFTNTPGNVAFLVRIMLTACLLIFLGGLAYTPSSRKIF